MVCYETNCQCEVTRFRVCCKTIFHICKTRMNSLSTKLVPFNRRACFRCLSISRLVLASSKKSGGKILDFPDMGPSVPPYRARENETVEQKRARLFYQSRKRGMSENGLLLSTFATLKLHTLDENLLEQYDKVINKPSNDWELFYWMTEKKPTPEEYDNDIMDMLKYHAKNEKMEVRLHQPALDERTTPTASPNDD